MIDFSLTPYDQAQLDRTREAALICRKYARYYDDNEGEFPPDELPEAADFYANQEPLPSPGESDTSQPVLMVLQAIGQFWGDYSVRLRQGKGGGLGNAALAAAGTPEQQKRWRKRWRRKGRRTGAATWFGRRRRRGQEQDG